MIVSGRQAVVQRHTATVTALRIVHLNDLAATGTHLVEALRAEGVEAILIDPARPGRRLRLPWRLATLPWRVGALLQAARRARGLRPDLVHVHYAAFAWLGALSGRPYLVHCHGTDVRGVRPGTIHGWLLRRWLSGGRAVLYATPDLEEWVHPLRPDAVALPNPIPIPVLPEAGPATTDLFIGVRFDPVKGASEVLETLVRLFELRPATTATMVRQGTEVERALAAIGDRASVIPFAPHASMPRIFAAHRLAIGQMTVGALGNYELEAMAAGLPVAARFSFPKAYRQPPPLIAVTTPGETARRLADMLEDAQARATLGAAARQWVATYHDPAAVAGRLIEIYGKVLVET
jgi:glycosyltransferase involved in cell wall biosynthesis